MDEYGNPIPGPSRGFVNEDNMISTVDCDFAWLENEFNNDDIKEVILDSSNGVQNNIYYTNEVEYNQSNNIEDFFEEIKGIDFGKNPTFVQNNDDIFTELLERCNSFIDIVGRNIVSLENMMEEVKNNIEISKKNAFKAHNCICFEKKSMYNTKIAKLKKKAHLANFFKIGLSNCPQNPHLSELYDSGRLILSYNGRFILEECVETNLWNQEFKNKLEQAIHEEVLDKLKIPMLEQHARLGKERERQNDLIIKHKIELEMSNIQKELETISNTPFQRLVFQFMDSNTVYDWLHIAKIIDKPYLQCQRFWNLLLKPYISRDKWTKEEDEKLIEIAKKYGEKNWQQIADELGINRNEIQCFVHFQKYKKMLNKKGKWSKQEDQKLKQIIKENSINNLINWQRVYFAMHDEGRTVDQIYNRWMCCLRPGIKKGLLTENEKLIIKKAHEKNLPPSVVSMNLTNRTSSQVRNAYQRIISNNENTLKGGWMPEEDQMLLCAINSSVHNEFTWSEVSKQVPGRNAEQCRHRFKLIEKTIQENPEKFNLGIFPRARAPFKIKKKTSAFNDESFNDDNLQENFKRNRQLLKFSNKPTETNADRMLKKSFLDNVYVTSHCNFSSTCKLFKYVLDYLGADLIVPSEFVHKDDLIDEGLMSMMTYLKEYSNESLTLDSNNIDQENITDFEFTYEGVDGVLRTSDIINSDLSEVKGLFDIRMKNVGYKSNSNNTINTVSSKKQAHPLPLYFMGSVPPNFETFKMLSTYMKCLSTCMKKDVIHSHVNFDWDNEESKKLHQRLVAIFRWPAIFSGTVDYNSANINMLVHTRQTIDSSNLEVHKHNSKKKKPRFNLKKCF